MLQNFLSATDTGRALRTLGKLASHDTRLWARTGGLAVELHHLRAGVKPGTRALNDIDFVAESFERIPETLADNLLFRHIHPNAQPGKTMLQLIDLDTALRCDFFVLKARP
jgi:hypothetical protein